jgi:hypothetical protein
MTHLDLGNSVALPTFRIPDAVSDSLLDPRSFGFSKVAYSVSEGR